MNILQILPELNVGGVETGTVDFASYLVQHGHKAVVVSNGGQLVPGLEASGARHYCLPVHKKQLWTMIRSVKALRDIICREQIDIVHARSRVPAWIAYFACRRTSAVFVTTCHGHYRNRWFSQVMSWSKLVIVPSRVIGRHMIEQFKVLPRSIRSIPRSVDLEKYQIQREPSEGISRCNIAIIGRITPLKGHTFFLMAMAKVVRTVPYAKIWIVGDAPAKKASRKQELQLLARRLGIENYVEFLGNRQDIPQILAKTDILVLSTVTQEAFGRVILEAQASGVPVVATKVGGVVDIIDDGQTGLLVLPKDTDAMADAVIRVAKDRNLARQLVARAKEKLKNNFTLEHMASATISVYQELLNSLNVLIIKIGSLGDVILITPSLKAIRKRFPDAKIHCLVGKESRKILHNCPYLDGVIVYDVKDKDRGWLGMLKISRKLRKYRFDIVIDFQNNRKSHLLSFLSFARESYGYNNGKWGWLLAHPLRDTHRDLAPVAHQFKILKQLGIQYKDSASIEMWPTADDKHYAQMLLDSEWLGNAPKIVGINIAASAKWQTKNWPIEYIARLCDMLSTRNIRVMITGMEKDKILAQYLLSITKSKPANLVGKTNILQLAELIKRCDVFVTPDSAPMHIAAAMETPVVALFGPTHSQRHLPPAKRMVVLEKKMACAPCYSSRCRIITHACMRDIQPDDVMREIESLMKEPS
ncbi:MAG: lipopolysaccharide heptosyltransferase II [Candidatus Omnitrophica bacterium]|nr:lipopolysaccharide heptosyltransferase II [Candidatus Omnitrophota bacterium]